MADNVTLPGTGSEVATDDVEGKHYQVVKIAEGVANSATLVNPATATKQDSTLTELQKKTEPGDIQNTELINSLRALLQMIATPVWYDPVTNTLKVGTHAVTVSSGTITTLTNQTNFGSNAADVMTRDTSINTWANVARRTIS